MIARSSAARTVVETINQPAFGTAKGSLGTLAPNAVADRMSEHRTGQPQNLKFKPAVDPATAYDARRAGGRSTPGLGVKEREEIAKGASGKGPDA